MRKDCNRRQVLINKKFQFLFIGKFLLFYLAMFVAFFVVMDVFVQSEAEAIAKSFATNESIQGKFRNIIVVVSAVSLVISLAVMSFFILLLSHRIAGPLYRFNSALQEMSEGNLTAHTGIRDKDQLCGISDSLSILKENLRKDFSEMKEICNENNNEVSGKEQQLKDIIEKYEV